MPRLAMLLYDLVYYVCLTIFGLAKNIIHSSKKKSIIDVPK